MPVFLTVVLAGCSTMQAMNPVNWWHDLEGGKIADQRPAPPGANDPYPNLAAVPAKPAPPDRDAMKKLTEGLVADRQNAQYTAAAAPLPDPSLPSASPGLFGSRTLSPPGPGSASASLSAASASPPPPPPPPQPASQPVSNEPPAPPAPAPVKPVASAPLPAPEMPAQPPAPAAAAAEAAMPAISAAPPPRPGSAPPPVLASGVGPVSSTAPVPVPAAANALVLAFDPGSAALTGDAAAAVKQVAAHRQAQTIVLTGYGDAISSDPSAQASALTLAMARAQSVATALTSAGVPGGAIRVGGEAAGRGVSLRLLQ